MTVADTDLTPEMLNVPNLGVLAPHADLNLPRRLGMGWERVTDPSYSWRGLERPDGPLALWQYTRSGCGMIERGGVTYPVPPGAGFLVEIPDDHHYYLPPGWGPWEFMYVLFDGEDLLRHLRWAIERHGPVFTLPDDSVIPQLLCALFLEVYHHQLTESEALAMRLYPLALQLRRLAGPPQQLPRPPIARAMQFVARHFFEEIGVEEVAQAAGLSRAHFSRLFHHETHASPLAYLTRVRLHHAMRLLRGTQQSLTAIAEQCGFQDACYFGKVFRKTLGLTPTAYRQGAAPRVAEETFTPWGT